MVAGKGFLDLGDAVRVGVASIKSFIVVGSLRELHWWCPRHQTFHVIHVWSTAIDPFGGLLVFEAFLEFMLGEEEASGFDDDELEDDWEAFIRFRRWELGYGSTSL